MGGNIVDQIFIALKLDTKDIEKGVQSATSSVANGLKNLFVGVVAPTLAAVASGEFISQISGEIVQIDRLSQSLGISMESLQAWQGSAEMAGVAAEEVGELFADLNDWMIDADQNQSGAMYEFIEKGLLPAVRDTKGELKGTEQYALELAEALKGLGSQAATGIGRQIGISNSGVVAWLQQGSGAIGSQMEQVKKLGVYTREDAKTAKEFTAALNDLCRTGKMLFLPLFRLLAPAAKAVASALTYLSKHSALLMPVLAAVAAVVGKVVAPSLLAAAKAALAFGKAFLFSPIGALIAALVALGLLLDDFVTWMDGGESALGDFWEMCFGSVENAKQVFAELSSAVTGAWEGIKAAVGGAVDVIGSYIGALIDILKGLFFFLDYLSTGNEESWNKMLGTISSFKEKVAGMVEGLKKMFLGLWDTIKSPLKAASKLFEMARRVPPTVAQEGGGTSSTDNSQHSTVINQTNNIQGASDPEAVADAVGDNTADLVANANVAYP